MNMQKLMREAKNMQKKFEESQENLKKTNFIGNSANGLVSVTLSGDFNLKSLKIDKSVVDVNDIETLEDLIVVAYNDAKQKLDTTSNESMNGFDLKNFKLPF